MSKTLNTPPLVLHANLPLLEVAEGWILEALLADGQARRLIVTRLSECVAIVAPGQLEVLVARLRKLGYTPRLSEE
jgi:hypothetical protein